MSRPSEMQHTDQLDAARAEAWDELRFIAAWEGDGTPRHEEGRRIVTAALRRDQVAAAGALDVIDPTGQSFPVAIAAAWDARKANA